MARPQATLMTINAWLALYGGGLAGVVLDDLPSAIDEDVLDYYKAVTAHVRSFGKLVVLNGTAGLDCRLAALGDGVVGFEGGSGAWEAARGDGALLPACASDDGAPAPFYVAAITRCGPGQGGAACPPGLLGREPGATPRLLAC
jgi:hypothetical protein